MPPAAAQASTSTIDAQPSTANPQLSTNRHWAFEPLIRPAVPSARTSRWVRNSIDNFVLAGLEKEHLAPSPEADQITLIRRLSFDLTGLPPSVEEVDRFITDRHPDAYEKLVDRLLASPQYGERWGRHWLDVVRFAESNGFETNTPRKNAWPYRDYVIRAFNEDKPYTRFIVEQLAGDALGVEEATGFVVGGAWDEVKSPDINLTLQQRMDELHDMVSTTSSAFLGLTVGCARCHNHKFDPISQTDYYAMQAIFAGVQHGERPLAVPDKERRQAAAEETRRTLSELEGRLAPFEPLARVARISPDGSHSNPLATAGSNETNLSATPRPSVQPRRNTDRFEAVEARFVRFTIQATTDLEPCIDELEIYTANEPPRNVALAKAGAKAIASGTYPNSDIHKLAHLNDGQYGNSHSWISSEKGKGWVQIELPEKIVINKVVWGRDREEKFSDRLATNYTIEVATETNHWRLVATDNDRRPYLAGTKAEPEYTARELPSGKAAELEQLLARKKELEEKLKGLIAAPAVYAGKFIQPEPTHRLYRGDPMQKREAINPGALTEFSPGLQLPLDAREQERRVALAGWICDPQNPLTARVMVNRIWHYHFGRGLVDTPSDFGRNGARPTNPELLDWLATEFIRRGWRVKEMHRLIALSSTYRQSSQAEPKALGMDAANRFLWRFPPQRLEAESIRDAILRVSGNLDPMMGGPGFDLFEPNNNYVHVYNSKREFGPMEWRRMVYQWKPRMQLDEIFGAFDCPDAGQIAPRRTRSTTALQALNLLNSGFIVQQAGFFADRLRREAGSEITAQVRSAFRLAFSREPARDELGASEKIIRDHGLPVFCRTIFNANEFVYVF